MKSKIIVTLALFLFSLLSPLWLNAADPAHPADPVHQGRGVVEAVDPAKGMVTVEHEPITSLKWPKMVMEFKARDPRLLNGLKEGDEVEFDLIVKDKNNYTITRIRRLP
jgi:membrane fusion protein, copper/silver efflux system